MPEARRSRSIAAEGTDMVSVWPYSLVSWETSGSAVVLAGYGPYM